MHGYETYKTLWSAISCGRTRDLVRSHCHHPPYLCWFTAQCPGRAQPAWSSVRTA